MKVRVASSDLLVVGGGSAGFAAAIKGAELGARVLLLEGGTLGGTCVNVGCVPSKTLIRAAETHHRRSHHAFAGIPATNGRPDWKRVREQKDGLVAQLRQAKYRDVLASYDGVTLVSQRAALTSGTSVRLADGSVVTGAKVIVTTGASPWASPIPGLAEAAALDSASAMALDVLPDSLIVIGAGAVGLELAQTFARLGVRVTVLEALPQIAPAEDPEIGAALRGHLAAEGIDLHTGVRVERVGRDGHYTVHVGGDGRPEALRADQLLVATGRRANTRGLGLDAAGVALGPRGEIRVNEYLQTANADVYAAGDVLGDPMFVYVAAYAGAVAAENALRGNARHYDLSGLPRVTFTDPAVAAVGLTDAQARERGIAVISAVLPLEHVPRALAAHDTRGLIKLVADARTRRLVGAHIVAAEAGEMITEPALAIRHGLTIEDLTAAFHPYLTLAEGIKLAAQTFDKDVAKLSCCAA